MWYSHCIETDYNNSCQPFKLGVYVNGIDIWSSPKGMFPSRWRLKVKPKAFFTKVAIKQEKNTTRENDSFYFPAVIAIDLPESKSTR